MLSITTHCLRFSYDPPRKMETQIPPLGARYQVRPHNIKVAKISAKVEKEIKRIKSELFGKDKVSVSSYDTAWVAMVGNWKECKEEPLFPECLEWIMQNQNPDGSWSSNPWHPLLVKDSLSSTLACVLALHKWNLGQPLVQTGLKFIGSNFWAATDEKQLTPIGFDIIFPTMIELARERGLKLPVNNPAVFDVLLGNRDTQVRRCDLKGITGAYLLEGIGSKYDWDEIIKYQRSNGSFFNSPSTTEAALFLNHNDRCYDYLSSLLKKYQNAVPTVYPLEIYTQLCMIDNLQKLGIDRYCRDEIERILDNIYRYWVQRDEEIFMDVNCCAMGFRLLRMNGYDVSSDVLAQFSEEERFFGSVIPPFKTTNTILELFKASKIMIYQKEPVLEKLEAWTSSFLKRQIQSGAIQDQRTLDEIDHALRNSYASLDFLESRRTIEQHNVDTIQLLKTSYRSSNDNNRRIWSIAVQDLNMCQAIFREEIKDLERWVKDSRLDQLKFARQKLNYSYFSSAAVLVAPELADARISTVKNGVLATIVDDLFDVGGSKQELENLILLFERWGESSTVGYCSKQVEIIFSAIHDMIKELVCTAFQLHGRSVERHLVKIWHDLLKSMMKEAEWTRENSTPTLDEYTENAYISYGLGPVCHITLYFLGATLPEEVITGPEVYDPYKNISLVGRLLNDLNTFKREGEQGKYNSVLLRVIHGQGSVTIEDAIEETKGDIERYRRELLRLVVDKEKSLLPKSFRDYFWKSSNIMYYFYQDTDGYSCPLAKIKDASAVLWEPILDPLGHST